jgi:hypothetical protein
MTADQTTEQDVATRPIDPDRLAELDEERSFLLRSLRDLDAEHDAGDIDESDYATLRDGYTKRAADVLRQLDAGRARLPRRRSASWQRRIAITVAVVALASGVGWFVARSSGQRLAGDEITGDAPSDVATMLVEARLLGGQDPQRALELYDEVLTLRPGHAEALTYSGLLLFSVGVQSADDAIAGELIPRAEERLTEAIEADPNYPDPHCFLAIVAAEYDGDMETAREEVDTCLALDPPADVRSLIEPFLDEQAGE